MPRSDATPLGGMLVHHSVILGPYVARTHLYTWVKRDKVKLSSLSKETMGRARLEPSACRSVVQGVNHLVTHPSSEMRPTSVSGMVTGDMPVSYWSIFSLSLVTVPEAFGKS